MKRGGEDAEPIDFGERRTRVLDALGEHAAMILPAAPVPGARRRDLELRDRPDPELFYLTGYTEPEAVAVLCPAHDEAPFTLFVRPRDPDRERWTGARGGTEAAEERFGADAAHAVGELDERLPKLVSGADTLYFRLGTGRERVEALVRRVLIRARKGRQRTGRGPCALIDPGRILDPMRLVKDADELTRIGEAAAITAEAFGDAIRAVGPGAGEWQVEAALEAGFRRRGASGPAFPSIVASGPNATVLHYTDNEQRMREGELALIDAGASWRMYHGDITRTVAVSGRFTPEQRALYDAVLEAHDAAIDAVRPGATIADVNDTALRVLVAAMVEHGLLEGKVDELIEGGEEGEDKPYKPFFPHKTAHWLGLEVHDVGNYAEGDEPRALEPGTVLTVEPGLYVPEQTPEDCDDAPEHLRGIGIRIEDDVVVTGDGREVLTDALPTRAEEVEGWVES